MFSFNYINKNINDPATIAPTARVTSTESFDASLLGVGDKSMEFAPLVRVFAPSGPVDGGEDGGLGWGDGLGAFDGLGALGFGMPYSLIIG